MKKFFKSGESLFGEIKRGIKVIINDFCEKKPPKTKRKGIKE